MKNYHFASCHVSSVWHVRFHSGIILTAEKGDSYSSLIDFFGGAHEAGAYVRSTIANSKDFVYPPAGEIEGGAFCDS